MVKKDLENIVESDGGQIGELLAALPRVEAPANFEYGVKAKIAASGESGRARFFPLLKVAVPLALVLVVASFVFFFGSMPGNDVVSVTPVADGAPRVSQTQPDPEPQPTTSSEASGPRVIDEPDVVEPERNPTFVRNAGPIRQRRAQPSTDNRQGGSIDLTQRSGNTIMPPGFESVNPRNSNGNARIDEGVEIPVRDIFESLGIASDFANGNWNVRSVKENSIAGKSGVRSNDVIEAIDGRSLSSSTRFKGQVTLTTLTIRRDGKQINLKLRN